VLHPPGKVVRDPIARSVRTGIADARFKRGDTLVRGDIVGYAPNAMYSFLR